MTLQQNAVTTLLAMTFVVVALFLPWYSTTYEDGSRVQEYPFFVDVREGEGEDAKDDWKSYGSLCDEGSPALPSSNQTCSSTGRFTLMTEVWTLTLLDAATLGFEIIFLWCISRTFLNSEKIPLLVTWSIPAITALFSLLIQLGAILWYLRHPTSVSNDMPGVSSSFPGVSGFIGSEGAASWGPGSGWDIGVTATCLCLVNFLVMVWLLRSTRKNHADNQL